MDVKRGRPVQSIVRANLVDILAVVGKGYGYELHKYYVDIFGLITRESVYYNLRKGLQLGEFAIDEIRLETGDYSWGKTVEKTYYKLGPNARVRGNPAVNEYFAKRKSTGTPSSKSP